MGINVALIGNPNVGKTVIFNELTGAKQHVGNFPGVTVEKKEGKCTYNGIDMNVVDLPGTYSLTARAIDELIARDYIVEENPDVVVDIVDAANIERNLYLTLLLLELEANLVVALNMFDVAESKGDRIDVEILSNLLDIPVVPVAAIKRKGIRELKEEIIKASKRKNRNKKMVIDYGEEIEKELKRIEKVVLKDKNLTEKYPSRWISIKLLERDEQVLKKINKSLIRDEIREVLF